MGTTPGDARDPDRKGKIAYRSLRRQLDGSALESHLALFYQSRGEQLGVATAFLEQGLQRNERCVYVADENDPRTIRERLADVGVDVATRIECDDLTIVSARDAYLGDGFDGARMAEFYRSESAAAADGGYRRLRIAGEKSWSLRGEADIGELLEFESQFDHDGLAVDCVTLCQYRLDWFDPADVVEIIHTHPQIIYDGQLCDNRHHISPSEFYRDDASELEAQRMLEQVRDMSLSSRRLADREQRLRVLNRILRHNMRNELNVVLGHLELIAQRVDDPDLDEHLDGIEHTVDRLITRSRKAQQVQDSLATGDVDILEIDLADVVVKTAERIRNSVPEATVRADVPESAAALGVPDIQFAIEELVINGIQHSERSPPVVEVAVVRTDRRVGETVDVRVETPEAAIPETERQVVLEGRETALEHGSGLGLWLVKWIAENAHGELSFEDDGRVVCLSLPAA